MGRLERIVLVVAALAAVVGLVALLSYCASGTERTDRAVRDWEEAGLPEGLFHLLRQHVDECRVVRARDLPEEPPVETASSRGATPEGGFPVGESPEDGPLVGGASGGGLSLQDLSRTVREALGEERAFRAVVDELWTMHRQSGVDPEIAWSDEVEDFSAAVTPTLARCVEHLDELDRRLTERPRCLFCSICLGKIDEPKLPPTDLEGFDEFAAGIRESFSAVATLYSWDVRRRAEGLETGAFDRGALLDALRRASLWLDTVKGAPDPVLQHDRLIHLYDLAYYARFVLPDDAGSAAEDWAALRVERPVRALELALAGLAARTFQGTVVDPYQPASGGSGLEQMLVPVFLSRDWQAQRVAALRTVLDLHRSVSGGATPSEESFERSASEMEAAGDLAVYLTWPPLSGFLEDLADAERSIQITELGVWALDEGARQGGGWPTSGWPEHEGVEVVRWGRWLKLERGGESWDLGEW